MSTSAPFPFLVAVLIAVVVPGGRALSQRDALWEFYVAADGPNWPSSIRWNQEDSYCHWFGVFCDGEENVVELNFYDAPSISGTLVSSLGELHALQNLTIIFANLNGTLPTELGKLSKLRTISIQDTSLDGPIPTEFGLLTNLNTMIISNNMLGGRIPSELAMLSNLSALLMANNFFVGTLPTELGRLSVLTELQAQGNFFEGTLPTELAQLRNLVELRMGQNFFEGPIPLEYYRSFSKVLALDLGFNKLSGTIPTEIIGLQSVNTIILSGNKLEGSLPTEIARLDYLRYLYLDNNRLTGSIPVEWEASYAFPLISELWLRSNELNGTIPLGLLATSYMVSLVVGNNSLEGPLPAIPDNMLLVDVSLNPKMNLSISYVELNAALSLTVNVTGTPAYIHEYEPGNPLQFGGPQFEFENMLCRQLSFQSPLTQLIGFDPAGTNYTNCHCASGYSGAVPQCTRNTEVAIKVGISLLGVAVLVMFFLLTYKPIIRWAKVRSELREAHALLEDYAALHVPLQQLPSVRIDSSLIIPFDDLLIVKQIGRGSSATVSMALWNHTVVACKEFHLQPGFDTMDFAVEASVHARLHHPNVVQLLGMSLEPPCMVTEWMQKGSLFHLLQTSEPIDARRVALDIARGMYYLHTQGILHRDLKSLNVLIGENGRAKVADFGLSRLKDEGGMTMNVGTSEWMAPELFHSGLYGSYDEKCDVYSYGIILWELATRQRPYTDQRFAAEIRAYVEGGCRPQFPEGTDTVLSDLAQRCWATAPQNRPTFEEVVHFLDAAAAEDL